MKTQPMLLAVMLLVVSSALSAQKDDFNPGYRGVKVGSALNTLPFQCKDDAVFCASSIGGDYIRVSGLEDKVLMFDVIYDGKTFEGEEIHTSGMSLAKAIKIHSLGSGMRPPALRWARGEGGRLWGVIDVANHIAYLTDPAPSVRLAAGLGALDVKEVSYLGSDAPVISEAQDQRLGSAEDTLIENAKAVALVAAATKIFSADDLYRAADRRAALKSLADQIDIVDGKATMTLALMNRMSTWLTVDKTHPDAISTAAELKKFYSEYSGQWTKLLLIAKVNRDLFVANEEAKLLSDYFDRDELIKRKARTLEAMGFEFN